ncbi:MAG: zinc-dependent metalloprotease, partial [Thermoleophilaceae bacterium]
HSAEPSASGLAPPRLLFVGPNLRKAVREMRVEPEPFHRWICAHELTHVFQFQGVPWLREHMSAMVREYLSTVDVRIDRGAAGGLPSMPNPARLVEAFREGGLAALVQTREQRALMARVQAAMAVVEGYSEHVMDAVAPEAIPGHEKLRSAMDARRRSRSAPERIVERLLGLDFKLRQYELGKRFCDTVADAAGMEGLNRVWESPEALPTAEELSQPAAWLERLGPAPAAAA